MVNSIFAVAWGRASDKDTGFKSHVFGGIVGGASPASAFMSACDYGGACKFDPFGTNSGSILTNSAVFFPISAEARQKFEKWVKVFADLRTEHRLPLYFSIDGKVNPDGEWELGHRKPVNINGEKHDMPEEEGFTWKRDPAFTMNLDPKNIQYSRANCLIMLAFLSRLSGINVGRLSQDFNEIAHVKRAKRVCDAVFKDQSCSDAVYVQLPRPQLKPFYEFVRMAKINDRRDEIKAREPFYCEAQAVPAYLQAQLV